MHLNVRALQAIQRTGKDHTKIPRPFIFLSPVPCQFLSGLFYKVFLQSVFPTSFSQLLARSILVCIFSSLRALQSSIPCKKLVFRGAIPCYSSATQVLNWTFESKKIISKQNVGSKLIHLLSIYLSPGPVRKFTNLAQNKRRKRQFLNKPNLSSKSPRAQLHVMLCRGNNRWANFVQQVIAQPIGEMEFENYWSLISKKSVKKNH